MSVSQNYGVLRVVRGGHGWNMQQTNLDRQMVMMANEQQEQAVGWLPEERFVYMLTRHETTIGRALGCDLTLFEPTVSREHARLTLDEQGWRIYNLTEQNTVSVNDCPVPSGTSLAVVPQDLLTLGGVVLQLVAPRLQTSGELLKSALQPLEIESLPRAEATNGHRTTRIRQESLARVSAGTLAKAVAFGLPSAIARNGSWNEDNALRFSVLPRRGRQTRWLLVALPTLIVVVVALVVIVLNSRGWLTVLAQNGPVSLVGTLTIPIIPAVGITLLVNFIDRFEREPWFLRLAAFLWGAIIAIPPALFIEQFIDTFDKRLIGPEASTMLISFLQGLDAGITEETIKGLGLLLLFFVLRDEFDNVTDGIVYGALIGAGFAMVENFFYFGPNPNDMILLIVGRIVLGWLCHSTFTVCFGATLGYIRHTRIRWQHLVIPLLGYLVAVSLHTGFDFINIFVGNFVSAHPRDEAIKVFLIIAIIANYIPPFIAQVTIVYFLMKALGHEAAIIREYLAAEVGSGIVSVEEYFLLPHSFARTKVERRVLRSSGFKQWVRVKELYQTEIGLAFRKWHVSMGDRPKLGYMQPEDAYRQRIQRLRLEIAETEIVRARNTKHASAK